MTEEPTKSTAATREEDEKGSAVAAGADRPPTPEEAEVAESAEQDPKTKKAVAEHYKEMNELGAKVEGEGRIP